MREGSEFLAARPEVFSKPWFTHRQPSSQCGGLAVLCAQAQPTRAAAPAKSHTVPPHANEFEGKQKAAVPRLCGQPWPSVAPGIGALAGLLRGDRAFYDPTCYLQ